MKNINSDTQIIARLNKTPSNRGIFVYNNYFDTTNINAVCLELHNSNLKDLIAGVKKLKFTGAIAVAFEYDQLLFDLCDEIDSVAEKSKVIGFITNKNGIIKGYNQGGYGIARAIMSKFDLNNKNIVILGAGHMSKSFLLQLQKENISPKSIKIYNRDQQKAIMLQQEFKKIVAVGCLQDLEKQPADIFINLSSIGAPWCKGKNYLFTKEFINKFSAIVDINFVPIQTQLIKMALLCGKEVCYGWEIFMHGTRNIFEKTLGFHVDLDILGKELLKDFEYNWD